MITARHYAASATIDDKIFVICGRTDGSSHLVNININEMYDFKTDKWTVVGSMPSKRSRIVVTTIYNRFFVFGRGRSGENIWDQ